MFKHSIATLARLLLPFSLLLAAAAQAAPVPAPPKIAASGYLLKDFHSGRILAEENADQRLEPASLTKLMTAYVVFRELRDGNIRLDDEVLVSEKAWRTPGSRMFIEVGKKVTVEQLLKGMIIQSGNDASVALAEYVAGSEDAFANLMNEKAAQLGMNDTHFVNATGLPEPDHYTTPRDILKVAAATIREFPEMYRLYSEREYTFNKIRQRNRNGLLWRDESVDGMKTGHTKAAGYCLVASAKRNDMRLLSVVMGTASERARLDATQALLNYGFRFYDTHRLYGAGEVLSRVRVWKGEQEKVPLGLEQDLYVTIPRRQYKNLEANMRIDPQLTAPIRKGQILGRVEVSLAGEPVTEVPLVALRAVAEGGLMQTLKDSVLLWFE